jgi:hypothetical protein
MCLNLTSKGVRTNVKNVFVASGAAITGVSCV